MLMEFGLTARENFFAGCLLPQTTLLCHGIIVLLRRLWTATTVMGDAVIVIVLSDLTKGYEGVGKATREALLKQCTHFAIGEETGA